MKSHRLSWIDNQLAELEKNGLLSDIKIIDSAIGSRVKIGSKYYLNFASNNYLGLANDTRIRKAAAEAIDRYGVGPAAVRTISGTTSLHKKLESELAKFKKVESVITLQSGFNANLAVVPTVVGEGDFIYSDELNHASIIDACRLSKAEVVRYKHLDMVDLELKLKDQRTGKRLIVTDGVFSMDGDIAPLNIIQKISETYKSMLMVDDAHGEGVLGEGGRGIVDHFGLHGKVDIEVGTLSKAFGVVGGMIAGSRNLIEWVRRRGRPFLFSSAMTIPDVAACIESVHVLITSSEAFDRLWDNTNYFKGKLIELGFNIGGSQTPITPIILGDEKLAQRFAGELFENGLFAVAIVYPTVGLGKARIRMMISASHARKELDQALEILFRVGQKFKVI